MKKMWFMEQRRALQALMAVAVLAVLGVGLLASARPAAAQQQTACYVTHIVQRGQYIAQIARLYNVTPQAILAANPQVTNPNLIFPGQALTIPLCGTPPPPPPPTVPPGPGTGGIPGTCRWWHYVTPGQTMLGISRLYGVSPFAIAEANRIFNLNLIYAGTTLCIP